MAPNSTMTWLSGRGPDRMARLGRLGCLGCPGCGADRDCGPGWLCGRAGSAWSSVQSAFFSLWPPNPDRMADSTLPVNTPSPRDSNRSYRAAVMAPTGTPVSMAA